MSPMTFQRKSQNGLLRNISSSLSVNTIIYTYQTMYISFTPFKKLNSRFHLSFVSEFFYGLTHILIIVIDAETGNPLQCHTKVHNLWSTNLVLQFILCTVSNLYSLPGQKRTSSSAAPKQSPSISIFAQVICNLLDMLNNNECYELPIINILFLSGIERAILGVVQRIQITSN